MKFEIQKDVMQDMIAIMGKESAITEMVSAYHAALEAAVEELEQELKSGK